MTLYTRIRADLQRIPSILTSIGGHREHKPKLNSRLVCQAGPMNEMQEIIEAATISQEIGSEIVNRLLTIARNAVMENFAFGEDAPLIDVLNRLGSKCTVIATPIILARLQTMPGFLNLRNKTDPFVSLPFVGLLGSHETFLDPYYPVNEALVCLPGWFAFNSGSVIYDGGYYPDPIEQNIIHEFYDDVDFKINPSLIKGLVPKR